MTPAEVNRFDHVYHRHLRKLKLQGKSQKTIDAYSRAVSRVSQYYDCCPDRLTPQQLQIYFGELVASHSWSTVKIDRNGLQFFWRYVLKRDWDWISIIKPPKIKTIPDILTPAEIEQLIGKTKKLRYRVFLLSTYSMGLRLEEALSLQVGDIDAKRNKVHIRRGKGHKDRLVPLSDLTLQGLRELWRRHRHPTLLFPNATGSLKTIQQWKKKKGKYLFSEYAMARVFRARFLNALKQAGFSMPDTPSKWVVDCERVGRTTTVLQYLSRYLYRGVISENNIVANQNGRVTFSYTESKTGKIRYKTLKGNDFLKLILPHVLPKGFRRIRDCGFLHGNAKKLLKLVQLVLHVRLDEIIPGPRPVFNCPYCRSGMVILGFRFSPWSPG